MDCAIYNPTIVRSTIIDPYNNAANLTFMSDTSMAHWGGKYWAICNASTLSTGEGGTDQQIWATTSEDAVTWSDPFQPFRDATYCSNPRTEATVSGNLEWQPNLVAVGDELWCTWSSGRYGFISKLTDPEGLWTNYRFEFDGDNNIYLSTTLTGAATGTRLVSPTVDGRTDWLVFPTTNPIVLSDGRVACPVMLVVNTSGVYSTQTAATSVFTRQFKRSAVLVATDDVWSMWLIDTSAFGDYCATEPFVVENPVGHIRVYTRNLNTTGNDRERLLVATSYDGGETFSASVASNQLVPNARGFSNRVSDRHWILTHCDHPFHSTGSPNQGGGYGRVNGALFVSRRGNGDFVPGVNFSGPDWSTNYPQSLVTPDGDLLVHWSSSAGGLHARTEFALARVSPLPSDDTAWIHPRSISRYDTPPTRPSIITGPPAYCDFNGRHRIWSVTSQSGSGGVSFAAWFKPDTNGGVLMDSRTVASDDVEEGAGHALLPGGMTMTGLNLAHTVPYKPGTGPYFVAGVVDNSTQTITVYASANDGVLASTTAYFKVMQFTGQPADADTVTINGVTYTFKTSPSGSNDVQIGTTVNATITSLKLLVDAASMRSGINGSVYVVARRDYAALSVSSGSSAITILSGLPLTAGPVSYGWTALSRSSLLPYNGRIYESWVHESALSAANIRSLYNSRASDFGYGSVSGTATTPGTALIHFDPPDLNMTEFPTPTGTSVAYCETLDGGDTLRIHGEESASIELPYGVTRVTIRFKLGATPTGTDKYVVASFGDSQYPARLYISGAEPTKLYLERALVATIADPTQYTTITADVYANKAIISGVEYFFSGKARAYLGGAFAQSLLATTKTIDYDITAMTVERKDH